MVNFASKELGSVGQGVITYANDRIIKWWTTLADRNYIAHYMDLKDHLSLLKLQLRRRLVLTSAQMEKEHDMVLKKLSDEI
ncbi:hypothetical protein CHS0354_031078 [Potamilus streckersoni]|uniref:Uncharacterized protein n=1 Tax=Potamilus streckersoni TaxID=2493646 RepID=A0AAE0RZP0_9BIVA|nr:hypothetical protein CHS0354_031078 [Potamilus streckersoni]